MSTILEALYQSVDKVPHDIALTLETNHVSYAQLKQRIEHKKRQLLAIGINHQSRVVLLLPNIIEAVVLLFACNALSSTVIMMHPLSSSSQINERCRLTQATHLFFLDALHKRYPTHRSIPWYKVSIADQISDVRRLYLKLRFALVNGLTLPKAQHSLQTYQNPPQDTAVILFSSGTTNQQKIIQLSNESFIALSKQMESCVNPTLHSDSMLCALPFFHGFGLGISLLTTLFLGGRAILVPKITQQSLIKTILSEKPTYIAGVPFLYRMLLKNTSFTSADLSFIKQAFIGGETVPLNLIHDFNAMLSKRGSQATLQVGYGTTETLTAVSLMPPHTRVSQAIGYPLIGNEMRILRDNQTLAEVNELGEIIIHGPTLMNDYLQEYPSETVWFIHQGKRYYRSNDLGYIDASGMVYFVSRKDDMIKSRGYLINPNEIEQLLYTIDSVIEVKVFNHKDTLSVIMACDKDTIIDDVKKQTKLKLHQLDDWSVPRYYLMVSDIPKNEMKKMNRTSIIQALNQDEIELLAEWTL